MHMACEGMSYGTLRITRDVACDWASVQGYSYAPAHFTVTVTTVAATCALQYHMPRLAAQVCSCLR